MKKYLKQLKANKKGFTLIEMIVVIAIIGVLAAILVPSMSGYISQAKESKKQANARTVYTAAQAAVTGLEAKDSVEAKTYYSDPTGDKDTNDDLFNKIKDLIGAANYGNFAQIEVTVDTNGAVTGVKVTDSSGDTKYPEEYESPSDAKAS